MGNPNAQFSGKSFELKKFDFYFHCIKNYSENNEVLQRYITLNESSLVTTFQKCFLSAQ